MQFNQELTCGYSSYSHILFLDKYIKNPKWLVKEHLFKLPLPNATGKPKAYAPISQIQASHKYWPNDAVIDGSSKRQLWLDY